MALVIDMPKLSDTMTEGVLVAWLKKEGERVEPGDLIAQVETDKATMDLEAFDEGVLLKQLVKEGETVPVGAPIAILGEEGEDISDLLQQIAGGGEVTAAREEREEEAPTRVPVETEAPEAPPSDGRIKASPLARKLAKEYGIDLSTVKGSGPEGRIVKRDIEAVLARREVPVAPPAPVPAPVAEERAPEAPPAPAPPVEIPYEDIKLTPMRKTIARRLSESKRTAPHFYLTMDIAMDRAVTFREELNRLAEAQGRQKISFNDLIIKACALALRQHPEINASYLEEEGVIRRYKRIHVAFAVALPEGLVTPVIRDADQKGLAQIAEEARDLAERARARQLAPEEMEGHTFTTSNLGMFGIEHFTAIINPPDVCILAIGAIRDEVVIRDGEFVAAKRMKVTLSCDHRAVDGAMGSRFLQTVKSYLEEPMNLML